MNLLLKLFKKNTESKRIVIVGTQRYSINAVDFYMLYSRTRHNVAKVILHAKTKNSVWWKAGKKDDKARLDCYEQIPQKKVQFWKAEDELIKMIKKQKPDYICVGNGNDLAGKAIREHFDKSKVLFSEYGWLPWNQHFYIARGGTATKSDIFFSELETLQSETINHSEIETIKSTLINEGVDVPYEKFIYLPLQVDENDFKFTLTDFKDNADFLNFVCDVVPADIKILAKNHPLNKKPTDLSPYNDRVIDISKANYSRGQLYQKMQAMVCINSTSVLEAIAFGRRVFAYGEDIYQNKGLVYENVMDKSVFAEKLSAPEQGQIAEKFISLLLRRQVNRKRCLSNDREYLDNHYWANDL